ncbi:MAG: methylmalonyl-CoA epimerase [Hydrocarboniphaga sp.]|nr:methylmalonyl-CoA epimerase [Hydrocarboniphaga sp.]
MFLQGLGYEVGELIVDPEQNVRLAMCRGSGLPSLELIVPADDGLGPLSSVLRRQDACIYHSCFTTHDADASLAAMAADSLKHMTVSPPKPAVLFGGRAVSFHLVGGFGLIELIHLPAPVPANRS